MVDLEFLFRFEPNQSHPRTLKVLDELYICLAEYNFFPSNRIERPDIRLVQHLPILPQKLRGPLQGLIGPGIQFLGRRLGRLPIQPIST